MGSAQTNGGRWTATRAKTAFFKTPQDKGGKSKEKIPKANRWGPKKGKNNAQLNPQECEADNAGQQTINASPGKGLNTARQEPGPSVRRKTTTGKWGLCNDEFRADNRVRPGVKAIESGDCSQRMITLARRENRQGRKEYSCAHGKKGGGSLSRLRANVKARKKRTGQACTNVSRGGSSKPTDADPPANNEKVRAFLPAWELIVLPISAAGD